MTGFLQAASGIESVKAIATIGAPAEPIHVKHLFEYKEDEINEKGEANVLLAGRPFKLKKQLSFRRFTKCGLEK